MYNEPLELRCSGRTQGLMLKAIGEAVMNPGKETVFMDHYPIPTVSMYRYHLRTMENIISKLGLDISVKVHSNYIILRSNWIPPYQKRSPVEEAWKKLYGEYPDINNPHPNWTYFKKGYESH